MTTQAVTVNANAQSYTATVRRDCGHEYRSTTAWNDEQSARRHGRTLAGLACSTCRDHR